MPVHWYSKEKTFITLPSWDKMKTPFGRCNIINIYGEPIYVNPEDNEEDVAQRLKAALFDLEKRAPEEFQKAKKLKLWKKGK